MLLFLTETREKGVRFIYSEREIKEKGVKENNTQNKSDTF
jgi:hypothetical protein